ncbi:hypothetical protein ACER0C_003406 [Sarotherodon galilaeus]
MRQLYASSSPDNPPFCSHLQHFASPCVPCSTSGEETAVVCQGGARPRFVNGNPVWSDTYGPKNIVYSPKEELQCVCKPGFQCSSEACITCIQRDESSITEDPLSADSDARTRNEGIVSAVCVLLGLSLIFGLAFRNRSQLRRVCAHGGHECRVGLSAASDCIIGLVGRLSRPAREAAVPAVSRDEIVVLDKPNCTGLPSEDDQVRRVGERRIAGLRLNIVLYAVIAVTLSSTLIVGTLYIADRLLINHCDSTISVYTFPLGYAVTSKGLGNLEAVALLGFLHRCRQQNEFTVPARVKFHKAIRCLRGSREYKRASADASQTKQSHGTKDSSSGHVGASGSFVGVTASAEVTFSKTDAVERSMERTVASSNRVSVSSSSYQCQVGSATFSSYEPSTMLRVSLEELNRDPEGRIDEFLDTWGYGFVSSVEVGGYYSSFEVFSTCNKDAENSLDDAAERCRDSGAKVEVSGFGGAASAGGSTSRCNTEGLSEYQKKALSSISKQSRYVQIGGDDLGGEDEWESTLKMNPYPLKVRITPIFNINGISPSAVKLLKLKLQNVQLYPDEFLAEQVPDIMPRRC